MFPLDLLYVELGTAQARVEAEAGLELIDCGQQGGGEIYFEQPASGKVYGNQYATEFRLLKVAEGPAVLLSGC